MYVWVKVRVLPKDSWLLLLRVELLLKQKVFLMKSQKKLFA